MTIAKVKKAALWTVALAAVAAVVVAILPSNSANAGGSGSKTIVVINPNLSLTPNAVGFAFNDTLYNLNGTAVGADSGACEALPPRGDVTGEYKCDTVFTFANGTVSATGIQGPGAGAGPVTGGTGAFEGCEGSVVGEPYTATPEPQDVKITLKLTECW